MDCTCFEGTRLGILYKKNDQRIIEDLHPYITHGQSHSQRITTPATLELEKNKGCSAFISQQIKHLQSY